MVNGILSPYGLKLKAEFFADAFMKHDMNPSLTSCLLRKSSPKSFLKFMYPDISTSLKVVSIAFVFWLSLSLSPVLILIRLIWTRVSVREPWMVDGAFLEVVEVVLPAAGWLGAGPDGVGGAWAGAAYMHLMLSFKKVFKQFQI
mgnify:CR=1 FL=1